MKAPHLRLVSPFRVLFAGLGLLLLAWPLVAAEPGTDTTNKAFKVRSVRNLAYRDLDKGEDPRGQKNLLDVFVPSGAHDFPVLVFIHGGAWRSGHKDLLGVYNAFGVTLARAGIGAVVPNYRLSPEVRHPGHIKDVARAFAWTYRNISKYGGRPDQLFVSGHSAGGHLAALLATDDTYLKQEGLPLRLIRGVMPMCGVFLIPEKNALFTAMFGTDDQVRHEASPIFHARSDAPPFLIIYADHDGYFDDFCGKEPAEAFCKALLRRKGQAETFEVRKRSHLTLMMNACVPTDPVAQALFKFIAAHRGSPAQLDVSPKR